MILNEIIHKASEFNQNDKKEIKENGVVFTNKNICDRIIHIIKPVITETICEPSVGKGAFIFALLEYFKKNHSIEELATFVNERLFCFDINEAFLDEFKRLLREYFILHEYSGVLNLNNIVKDDFLLQSDMYDVIIGNPPYVRIQNIDKEYLDKLKVELKSVSLGNIDLYYAFLEKALLHSNRVGFIIPNSFIKNKSGSFIRDIIKDRLSYIYDFKSEKVWSKISTYTSIIVCDKEVSDIMIYETDNVREDIDKSLLGSSNWIFESIADGDKGFDMVNHHSGGIATIKDDVFKVDSYDDLYCYKNGFKIEKDMCKKYIKATTTKDFDGFKYIIYPYDSNGKVINEADMVVKYPLCLEYFNSRKDDLLSRDKGKTSNYDSWYAYGRRQGLLKSKKGIQLILPLTYLKSRGVHYITVPENEECLVLSGILIDIKPEGLEEFLDIINTEHFYKYCELNNKVLGDKGKPNDLWLSISSTTIKNYTY